MIRQSASAVVMFIVFVSVCFANVLSAESCLSFSSPKTGSMVISSVCTLAVEAVDCERRVKKVDFGVRYFKATSDTPTIESIGSSLQSPFIYYWDISKIPNQLFSGVTFFADITFSNDNVESLRNEGVFFLHQPLKRPVYEVPYNFSGTKKLAEEAMNLHAYRSNLRTKASVYWNEKDLTFIVDVHDPIFTKKLSRDQLAATGIEILLDPSKSRKPWPNKDILIYSVPLNGKPFRIEYKRVPNDSGAFRLAASTVSCDIEATIITNEGKGFRIVFSLPVTIFGKRLPETIGANIVVKTLSSKNEVIRSSWVNSTTFETYSPYVWGELRLKSKAFFMNRVIVTLLFFGIAFFVTLLIAAIIIVLSRHGTKKDSAKTEADRQQFLAVKEEFDRRVTEKKVSVEDIGKAVSMPPKSLSSLVKRATGMNFHTYIMFARIEIAKERLRSSHASEGSIAEACGFITIKEMEKYFLKFYHITPQKFRSEQQVT